MDNNTWQCRAAADVMTSARAARQVLLWYRANSARDPGSDFTEIVTDKHAAVSIFAEFTVTRRD